MRRMHAELKSLHLEPDPSALRDDPAEFSTTARLVVGPVGGESGESFDVVVCTSEWLREQCRDNGGILDARHHVVVDVETFDQRALRAWFVKRVRQVEAPSWAELGQRLSRLGQWEFEDYRT